MIAYHIDRLGTLEVGQKIGLTKFDDIKPPILNTILNERYKAGLSIHGERYFASPPENSNLIFNHFYELIFEYERSLNFPKLPSRFQSYFACETKKEISDWMDHLELSNPKIVEIQFFTPKVKKLDARFLDIPSLNYSNISEVFYARNYWKGTKTSNPLWELVIGGEIEVTKILS